MKANAGGLAGIPDFALQHTCMMYPEHKKKRVVPHQLLEVGCNVLMQDKLVQCMWAILQHKQAI
jgi:hypothetical protein